MQDAVRRLVGWAFSAANACGLLLAAAPLAIKGLGLLGTEAFGLAGAGYVAGYVVGGLLLGFPALDAKSWVATLNFSDQGSAREVIENALGPIRTLVDHNPEGRLTPTLQQGVRQLCNQLDQLLLQWEGSKGALSLEEEFHARHLASRYLPEALKTYLSIPRQYANERLLENGRTAHDTLVLTLQDLTHKVSQLADDLAAQDAQAFLTHSRFLGDKFRH